jgi:hypothetical protein
MHYIGSLLVTAIVCRDTDNINTKFSTIQFYIMPLILFVNKIWTPLAVFQDTAWSVTLGWHIVIQNFKLQFWTGLEWKEKEMSNFSFLASLSQCTNNSPAITLTEIQEARYDSWPYLPLQFQQIVLLLISGMLRCWSLLKWNIANSMAIISAWTNREHHLQFSFYGRKTAQKNGNL